MEAVLDSTLPSATAALVASARGGDRDAFRSLVELIAAYAAPCGQSGSYLQVGWPLGAPSTGFENTRRYLGEPSAAIASDRGYGLRDTYDASASMPTDATFSGFATVAFQLWTSPTTVDRAMYLRFADHVELWPRSGLWSCS